MPYSFFLFQPEDGIRDIGVTGVQTCALPISFPSFGRGVRRRRRFEADCLSRDSAAPHPDQHRHDENCDNGQQDPPDHRAPPDGWDFPPTKYAPPQRSARSRLRLGSPTRSAWLAAGIRGYLNASRNEKTAGTRMTTNIAGKMNRISGNSIFTGALWARSSALARLRLRMSPA